MNQSFPFSVMGFREIFFPAPWQLHKSRIHFLNLTSENVVNTEVVGARRQAELEGVDHRTLGVHDSRSATLRDKGPKGAPQ